MPRNWDNAFVGSKNRTLVWRGPQRTTGCQSSDKWENVWLEERGLHRDCNPIKLLEGGYDDSRDQQEINWGLWRTLCTEQLWIVSLNSPMRSQQSFKIVLIFVKFNILKVNLCTWFNDTMYIDTCNEYQNVLRLFLRRVIWLAECSSCRASGFTIKTHAFKMYTILNLSTFI